MPRVSEESLLQLLDACAAHRPEPLYPSRFAAAQTVDRDTLDVALEELRRRGVVKLTDWVKDLGQGYTPTDAGLQALAARHLPTERAEPTAITARTSVMGEYERGEIARAAVFEPSPPYISRALLAANVLFFVFGAFYAWTVNLDVSDYIAGNSPTTIKVLIRLGALHQILVFSPEIDAAEHYGPRPQFERIVLCCFLHIGIIHLAMNMYFLYSLGPIIESMWGSVRFLIIYTIAGIVSGCVVLQFQLAQRQGGITAGASGCLYGIFASMVVWFLLNRRHLPDRLIRDWSNNLITNAVLLIAINFVLSNVSWQGHLGGAIGGFFAAILLHVQRFDRSPALRWSALLALPIVPIAFFAATLWQAGYFEPH